MHPIAIFENEDALHRHSFDAINVNYFSETLEFSYFQSSQSFGDLANIKNYDLLIVDIDLSRQSELDGFDIIKKALELDPTTKIIIFSGIANINQKLTEHSLPKIEKLDKPLKFDIAAALIKRKLAS